MVPKKSIRWGRGAKRTLQPYILITLPLLSLDHHQPSLSPQIQDSAISSEHLRLTAQPQPDCRQQPVIHPERCELPEQHKSRSGCIKQRGSMVAAYIQQREGGATVFRRRQRQNSGGLHSVSRGQGFLQSRAAEGFVCLFVFFLFLWELIFSLIWDKEIAVLRIVLRSFLSYSIYLILIFFYYVIFLYFWLIIMCR